MTQALTPVQRARQARFERLIALAAPALDLVLGIGERISRIAGPEDDYYPIRAPGEAFELPPRDAQESRPGAPDVG